MNARIFSAVVLLIVVLGFGGYQTYQLGKQNASTDGVVEFIDLSIRVSFDGGKSEYNFYHGWKGHEPVEILKYDGGLVEYLSAGYLGDRNTYKVYSDRKTGSYYRVLSCEELGGGQAVCEEAPVERLPPHHQEILRRGREVAAPYVISIWS